MAWIVASPGLTPGRRSLDCSVSAPTAASNSSHYFLASTLAIAVVVELAMYLVGDERVEIQPSWKKVGKRWSQQNEGVP